MNLSTRERRESDLIAYYNTEAGDRAARELPAERVERRCAYLDLLAAERRHSVLEVGAGPGRDGEAFAAAGFAYTGVDLAPVCVSACRSLGLDTEVASVLDLPYADDSFDAGWTMSTLLHVADSDLDAALSEIARVLRPGAPLAIGLWGGPEDREQFLREGARYGPPRFFSIRTDETVRSALGHHGTLEQWATWPGTGTLHYQWAVLRTA